MSNRLTTTHARPAPVRDRFDQLVRSGAIQRALPTGMSEQRFTRVVLTELSKNPGLAQCRPETFLGAVMTAAQLGLDVGSALGMAYLVPYKDTCTLIVGYRGMVDLARRSGQLRSIVARTVHEHDEFDYSFGLEPTLRHRPRLTDRGKPIAYYGVAILADGGSVIEVMSRQDVEQYRRRSATQRAEPSGPWTTDYDAMAAKTVIRRMFRWLPVATEAAQAIESDERVITLDPITDDVVIHGSEDDSSSPGEAIDVAATETDPPPTT
jgi:recombination protein RecT